jgi:hypothetical protein
LILSLVLFHVDCFNLVEGRAVLPVQA